MERLKNLVEKKPEDPFPRYGLAMEHKNREDHREAIRVFQQLVEDHPDYTAAYFHFGMSLQAVGEQRKAEEVLGLGIEVAEKNGESHAREELQAALAELQTRTDTDSHGLTDTD